MRATHRIRSVNLYASKAYQVRFTRARSLREIVGIGSLASSGDGLKIVAITANGAWTSTDGGVSWVAVTVVAGGWYTSAGSSEDGNRLVVSGNDPSDSTYFVATSSDGGATWKKTSHPSQFNRISVSGDGLKIAAVEDNGLWVSTDGGETWLYRGASNYLVTWSKDGSTLLQLRGTYIWRSINNGETWKPIAGSAWSAFQNGLASNANGSSAYAINCFNWSGPLTCFPYSSALNTVSEIQGIGELKLIYLGNGLFGPAS